MEKLKENDWLEFSNGYNKILHGKDEYEFIVTDNDNNKINLKDLLLINKEKYKKYFKHYISSTLKKQETFIKFIESSIKLIIT
jgi:hypothetical protein